MSYKHLFVVLYLLLPLRTIGQVNTSAFKLSAAIDTFNVRVPNERVFIHIDRPYYSNTDTIWIKAYVFDAGLSYSVRSGLLYTELIDDTGKVVLRLAMPVKLGISFGQIILNDKIFAAGSYTLRAYTNWMQNQGESSFFTRRLYIGTANDNQWQVTTANRLANGNLHMAMAFVKNSYALPLQDLRLKVLNGDATIASDNVKTDITGKLDFNFNLPGKDVSKQLRLVIQAKQKNEGNKQLVIPISVNRPENTDLQFMPEGGQLIVGLACRVGFKAISEDGTGTPVHGTIVNSNGLVVADFSSEHLGMGSFSFTPQQGDNYEAKTVLANGIIKTYPLPQVKQSGINLHVFNGPDHDSLIVIVSATADIIKNTGRYSLIAQAAGKVCYAANLLFDQGIINGLVAKNKFPTGLVQFTIFNSENAPVAERLIFIDHGDGLNIELSTDKPIYHPDDSIALHLKVTDKHHNPVTGSFSLAITDDSQIKADSNNMPDIKSYMLLTSYVSGDIEQPGYYFDKANTDRYTALDNLLLTQGWVGYYWQTVFNKQYQPPFKAEPEIAVSGKITRVGGKSVSGLAVMLLSIKKPALILDTVSDNNGRFIFRNLPHLDTVNFMLQVKDKKGKMFEATINIDEFTPAKVTKQNSAQLNPWYVNSDSTLLNYMNKSNAYAKALDNVKYPEGIRRLKEVKITDKKIIKGSHNLNGPGNADQVIDEQEMIKAKNMPLEDFLYKQVKNFNRHEVNVLPGEPAKAFYAISEKQVKFVIDGVALDFFYNPRNPAALLNYEHFNFLKDYLSAYTAEDVRGIEILYNGKYTGKYRMENDAYVPSKSFCWDCIPPIYSDFAYIEITTWSGNGAFMKRTPGRYLYRPIPMSWPKQFYHPKYSAKSNTTLTDLRSTVYWEPNIITDTAGKATVWFYAKSDKIKYTGILQGSDLNGKVGAGRINISVDQLK